MPQAIKKGTLKSCLVDWVGKEEINSSETQFIKCKENEFLTVGDTVKALCDVTYNDKQVVKKGKTLNTLYIYIFLICCSSP
jgi:hypothetical protein